MKHTHLSARFACVRAACEVRVLRAGVGAQCLHIGKFAVTARAAEVVFRFDAHACAKENNKG